MALLFAVVKYVVALGYVIHEFGPEASRSLLFIAFVRIFSSSVMFVFFIRPLMVESMWSKEI